MCVRETNDNALLIYLHVHEGTERKKLSNWINDCKTTDSIRHIYMAACWQYCLMPSSYDSGSLRRNVLLIQMHAFREFSFPLHSFSHTIGFLFCNGTQFLFLIAFIEYQCLYFHHTSHFIPMHYSFTYVFFCVFICVIYACVVCGCKENVSELDYAPIN